MATSIIEPLDQARLWTHAMLFRQFDLTRWFALGFCAWLASLGRSGGNFNWVNQLADGRPGAGGDFGSIPPEWIAAIVVIVVVLLALALALMWLSSRGTFMFLDGVVRNDVRIGRSWTEFAAQGNSLFGWQLLLVLGMLVVLGLFVAVAFGAFWAAPEDSAIPALLLVPVILGAVGITLAFGLIQFVINDLVVPLMYLRRSRFGPAWSEAMTLVSRYTATLILYLLFRIVIGVALFVLTVLTVIFTCCIAALPYIGTVIRLPLFVFVRSYNLYFLSQLGGDLDRFARLGEEGAMDLAEVFE